ncbi:MAG: hypothetical protein V4538_01690 [Bacteroidota bacterium]
MKKPITFKDVAHHYWGCTILTNADAGNSFTLDTATINLVRNEANLPNHPYKPVLRRINDICLEEAAMVMQMVHHEGVEYSILNYKISHNEAGTPIITINNDWYKETLCFGNLTGAIWNTNESAHFRAKVGADVFHFLYGQFFDMHGLIDSNQAYNMRDYPQLYEQHYYQNIDKLKTW